MQHANVFRNCAFFFDCKNLSNLTEFYIGPLKPLAICLNVKIKNQRTLIYISEVNSQAKYEFYILIKTLQTVSSMCSILK